MRMQWKLRLLVYSSREIKLGHLLCHSKNWALQKIWESKSHHEVSHAQSAPTHRGLVHATAERGNAANKAYKCRMPFCFCPFAAPLNGILKRLTFVVLPLWVLLTPLHTLSHVCLQMV